MPPYKSEVIKKSSILSTGLEEVIRGHHYDAPQSRHPSPLHR